MADFIETSKSRNAKRTYDKIADVNTFEAAVSAFEADTTMGLTRKEASSEVYKTRIDYFDAKGEDKGYLNFYAADKTAYTDMASLLTGTEAAVQDSLFPLMKRYYRKYPKLVEAMATRHELYNASLDYIARKEAAGELLVLRPQEKLPIGRTEKDPEKLRRVYEIGRQTAQARLGEIQAYLSL